MTVFSASAESLRAGRDISDVATLPLSGIAVAALSRAEALARLTGAIAERRHLKLAFCNAHTANLAARDRHFRETLAGFLVLPDGIGVDLGARILHNRPFPANLNGTDLIPALLATAQRPLSVALLGARPGVADRAAAIWAEAFPRHRFSVRGHGYVSEAEMAPILAGLAADPPDLLLVAMGNPRQELWIARHVGPAHATVAAGIGALIDFTAGEVARAPRLFIRLRIEWVHRLAQEPGRLWRRYVIGNPVFLARMLGERLAGERRR